MMFMLVNIADFCPLCPRLVMVVITPPNTGMLDSMGKFRKAFDQLESRPFRTPSQLKDLLTKEGFYVPEDQVLVVSDPHNRDQVTFRIDVDFQDPGGRSCLRRATRRNPRNKQCPTCKKPNKLTPRDVALDYQCDECADRLERGI
jgi:hypothetical protein